MDKGELLDEIIREHINSFNDSIQELRRTAVESEDIEPIEVVKTKRIPTYKKTWGLPIRQKEELRNVILNRDGHKCCDCGDVNRLQIHHIVERANGGSNEESNLITLCPKCHAEKHKNSPIYRLMYKDAMRKLQR